MRKLLTFLLGLVVTVGLAGCDSGGGNGGDGPTTEVRFVHASADAGPVDVVVGGETVASDVSFNALNNGVAAGANLASPYFEVPTASDATIEVQDANGNTVISTTAGSAGLQENAQYTVVVAGAVAAGDNTPQPIVLRDRFQTSLGDGEVGLRLVHGAAGAGAVDIYLTDPNSDPRDASPLSTGFSFGGDFPGSGQFVAQGLSDTGSVIWVMPEGVKNPENALLRLPVGGSEGLSIPAGQYVTGIAIDNPGATPPAGALIQFDNPDQ